eukprot:3389342-Lingulodinium_polyedra.AAC.1
MSSGPTLIPKGLSDSFSSLQVAPYRGIHGHARRHEDQVRREQLPHQQRSRVVQQWRLARWISIEKW